MLTHFSRSPRPSLLCTVGLASLLTLTGCVGATAEVSEPGAVSSTQAPEEPAPSPDESGTQSEAALSSEPSGTWELEPGLPVNAPAGLPFPEGRWIAERSTPFDETGGMTDFWVTQAEFELLLGDFEGAGWEFGKQREGVYSTTQVAAFNADQTLSLNFMFRPQTPDRDSNLTITYVVMPPRDN